ncbi:MAG: hypothetical protein CL759_09165 [Chloroflexi bacterium]|nr:hypothetical protein [Chloroflexota bacterium]
MAYPVQHSTKRIHLFTVEGHHKDLSLDMESKSLSPFYPLFILDFEFSSCCMKCDKQIVSDLTSINEVPLFVGHDLDGTYT